MPQLPVIQPAAPEKAPGFGGAVRPLLLRLYRLLVVLVIVLLIHRHIARLMIDGDAPITTTEVRAFLPEATSLKTDESERLGLFVLNRAGDRVGYVLRTAPLENHITGYAGPTDTLIVLDRDMRVMGIRVRSSRDTVKHLGDVVSDEYFMKLWNGKTWDQVAGMDPHLTKPQIEGVSGASLTSLCIANGIHQRFRATIEGSHKPAPRVRGDDIGLFCVIGLAGVMTFTRLRGNVWARRAYQAGLIGYVGFWNGNLLAQSLLSGWAASSIPWRLAPGLVLLLAVALVVPWSTRRAIYCSQICPHGAFQEWLGRISRRRLHLHRGLEAGLRWIPGLLNAFTLVVTIYHLPIDLADIEPFDAYLIRSAGVATIVIAIVGLVVSAFVPMAYCKFGCPTGLVLSFVRAHGSADRFGAKDFAAGLMVALSIGLYASYPMIHHWIYG